MSEKENTTSQTDRTAEELSIGRGIGFAPHLLKDAEFSMAKPGGRIYCHIKTSDGVRHSFTRLQALKLSGRGGKYVARFRAFLIDEGGWNEGIWRESETPYFPSDEEVKRARSLIRATPKQTGQKPTKD